MGTVIGPTNYPANYAQSADFDDATGTLYWAAYQGSGISSIRTINLATGNSTEVIPTDPFEADAFVIEESPDVVPVSDWAIYLTVILIITFAAFRFRRLL